MRKTPNRKTMPTTTDSPLVGTQTTTEERIYDWKITELRRAGFKRHFVEAIARSNEADWRQAIDLLKGGCDPFLAAVICGALEQGDTEAKLIRASEIKNAVDEELGLNKGSEN